MSLRYWHHIKDTHSTCEAAAMFKIVSCRGQGHYSRSKITFIVQSDRCDNVSPNLLILYIANVQT